MSYFVSEDTKISGKLIQFISWIVDIVDQSACKSVSQSVSLSLTDKLTSAASQSVLERETDFYKCLISFQKIQNISGN